MLVSSSLSVAFQGPFSLPRGIELCFVREAPKTLVSLSYPFGASGLDFAPHTEWHQVASSFPGFRPVYNIGDGVDRRAGPSRREILPYNSPRRSPANIVGQFRSYLLPI